LSLMETLADRPPAAVGVKMTLIVQLDPAARVLEPVGQVLVWAKSPLLVPVMLIPLIVRAAVPLLVRVTVCVELLVPVCWLAKVRLVGLSVTAGAIPVGVLRNLLSIFAVICWLLLLA